jgi:hypothetical protein
MALTYAEYYKDSTTTTSGGDITSNSFSVAVGDVVCVVWAHGDDQNIGTITISNTGTAQTWNAISTQSGLGGNCYVRGWYAVATAAESITVSIDNSNTTSIASGLSCIVHTGAHATTPIPAGNIYGAQGGNDVSQAITPTSSGSCLWMWAADWQAKGALTPNANCTAESSSTITNELSMALIRPTTQPRTDANAFTVGEAADGDGETTAWIAWEVQAAAGGATPITKKAAAYYRMMRSR